MKKCLVFLAAALFATTALGAEVTTSGLLGVSGESGLVDGATVSDQTITFKPTANGGAILILGYDDSTNEELFRHMIPVKALQLNAANAIFQLKSLAGTTAATVTDKRLLVYSNGRALRTEFSIVGKVTGAFGGAAVDGLGDGNFIWTASTTAVGPSVLTMAKARNDIPGFTSKGWAHSAAYDAIVSGNGGSSDEALCTHLCGNPASAGTESCSGVLAAHGPVCVAACNCYHAGANSWNTCGTSTCESGSPGGGGG